MTNEWHVVVGRGGYVLGVFGSALLSDAQACAARIERDTGYAARLEIARGDKPFVGMLWDSRLRVRGSEISRSNVRVEHVRLDASGYDRSGRYWGVGPKLYLLVTASSHTRFERKPGTDWAGSGDGDAMHVRAENAADARRKASVYATVIAAADKSE